MPSSEAAEVVEIFSYAIIRTDREIALMQEYRTRLTADLVTGKLDVPAEPTVREWMKKDEPEEANK